MSHRSSGKLPSAIPNAYAGGYSEAIKKQLQSVELPEKVKCKTCKKYRMQSCFAKRQLEFLINAVVVQGGTRALNGPGHASCRNCTAGQIVELRCCICDQTKGLEEFAKSQRHEHDSARCIDCVQGHKDAEPVLDEQKLLMEGEMSTAHESILAGSQVGLMSLERSIGKIGFSNTSRYNYGTDDGDDDHSVGGGCWVETEHTENTRSRPEIAASVHSGWVSWGINMENTRMNNDTNQSFATLAKKKESRFAKVPGKRFEKNELLVMRAPEPARHTVPSDDEEEDAGVEDFL